MKAVKYLAYHRANAHEGDQMFEWTKTLVKESPEDVIESVHQAVVALAKAGDYQTTIIAALAACGLYAITESLLAEKSE